MTPSTIFGWTIMAGGTYALIRWIGFIMPDALDDSADQLAYGDWPHVPTDVWEKKAAVLVAGGKSDGGQRPSVTSQTNQNQTRLQTNNSHSTSPANFAGLETL